MKWRDSLSQEPQRSRAILSLLSGGIFLALPIPILDNFAKESVILLALWVSMGLFAYTSFFSLKWVWPLGFLNFALSLVHALSTKFWLIFVLYSCLLLWMRRRMIRAQVFALLLILSAFSMAQAKTMISEYKLDALASCGNLDKIPWSFKPDGRRTRKLFQEELRLANDLETYWWELHQVMNKQGEVTFVFRRSLPDGSYMSLAARDFKFIRVHSTPDANKKMEKQTFKHLINRPALIFNRADGTTVNYLPGSVGKATIQIQFAKSTGAYLPPVYIRGNFCDRPASLSESDVTDKSFGEVKNIGNKSKNNSK